MTPAPRLNRDGEAVWRRFKLHLEWSEHFALVFIFNADPRVTEVFRERLADIHRARVTRMRRFECADPAELADSLLPKLLTTGAITLDAPYWVDLSLHAEAPWRAARMNFLARLNEQRESLRRRLLKDVGETPAALRDLSVSLNDVGGVAQALARWDEARTAYRDALAVAEMLAQAMPQDDDYRNLRASFARSQRS